MSPISRLYKAFLRHRRAASPPTTTSTLLGLPGELRNHIYTYVLVDEDRIIIDRSRFVQPGLLRSCRQIREEARSIYYLNNAFGTSVRDLDPYNLIAFKRQAGNFGPRTKTEIVIYTWPPEQGQLAWSNLMKWLEAYHNGRAPGLRGKQEERSIRRRVVARAFDVIDTAERLPWEQAVKVLGVYRKGCATRFSSNIHI